MLHVDLQAPLDLSTLALKTPGDPGSGWVATSQVDMRPMQKAWLKENESRPVITASWSVRLPGNAAPPAAAAQPAAMCQQSLNVVGGKAICFAIPAAAAVSVTATATYLQLKDSSFSLTAEKGLPIPQWGKLQLLSLSAGFGSNKQLSMTLDKFGQVSSMKWTSEARAETVTGGLAGIASQVSGIVSANSKIARDKAEIDALTTQQTLNRLRACRQILDAGGSACPADAPVQMPQ
jgi:hypothetical protein